MKRMQDLLISFLAVALVAMALWPVSQALIGGWQSQADQTKPQARRPHAHHDPGYDVAEMYKRHFNKVNDQFWTGGQPPMEELARLKEQGIKAIINLRDPREHDEEAERAEAKRLGLRYFNIPVIYDSPKDEQVDEFLRLTDDPANRPALVHCTMAIRVSAFWMIRRVVRDGWTVEKAAEEAERVGPPARHLRRFADRYIEKHRKAEAK